jgi:nanoRNase/pAp phosphatase (c-di-AMP/oligoRNAs hydrolase)
VNASALAGLFGGGGHRRAAAYNDSQAATAEEAVTNLLARAESFL